MDAEADVEKAVDPKPSHQVTRVINDPETLRLIADPLRLRLLELLRQEPRTVTELAELLDVQRTKLYYHVKLLEAHDLIVVDETRMVSGITEKRYRVTAYRLSVDKGMLGAPGSGDAPLDVYLSMVLDEVATEIRRSVRSGLIDLDRTHEDVIAPRRVMLGRQWYWLTEDDVKRFQERYVEALVEFDQKHASAAGSGDDPVGSDGAVLYEWLTAFYPVVPPDRGTEL